MYNPIGKKPKQGVSVVGGVDMVGDGNSAVLQIFLSEHYISSFPLLTDACLTSHDCSSALSGWVINVCYVLDIFCEFTSKSFLYAPKLCASCFQQLCAQPKVPEESTLGGRESSCRAWWLGVVEGEGALGGKGPLFMAASDKAASLTYSLCNLFFPDAFAQPLTAWLLPVNTVKLGRKLFALLAS